LSLQLPEAIFHALLAGCHHTTISFKRLRNIHLACLEVNLSLDAEREKGIEFGFVTNDLYTGALKVL
jgi:hypothetical protein